MMAFIRGILRRTIAGERPVLSTSHLLMTTASAAKKRPRWLEFLRYFDLFFPSMFAAGSIGVMALSYNNNSRRNNGTHCAKKPYTRCNIKGGGGWVNFKRCPANCAFSLVRYLFCRCCPLILLYLERLSTLYMFHHSNSGNPLRVSNEESPRVDKMHQLKNSPLYEGNLLQQANSYSDCTNWYSSGSFPPILYQVSSIWRISGSILFLRCQYLPLSCLRKQITTDINQIIYLNFWSL